MLRDPSAALQMGGGLYGLFNNPYDKADEQIDKRYNQGAEYQNPFYKGGTNALGDFQSYLGKMSNPTEFINNLMSQYQRSPAASFNEKQGMRGLTNYASANGLIGSTPFMQAAQQNAHDISSNDMESWLSHILGINTQYGQGLGSLMQNGQGAANQLSSLYSDWGKQGAADASNSSKQGGFDWGNLISGAVGLAALL